MKKYIQSADFYIRSEINFNQSDILISIKVIYTRVMHKCSSFQKDQIIAKFGLTFQIELCTTAFVYKNQLPRAGGGIINKKLNLNC